MFINLVQGYYSTDTIVLIAKCVSVTKSTLGTHFSMRGNQSGDKRIHEVKTNMAECYSPQQESFVHKGDPVRMHSSLHGGIAAPTSRPVEVK